jgi:hypothetical protein
MAAAMTTPIIRLNIFMALHLLSISSKTYLIRKQSRYMTASGAARFHNMKKLLRTAVARADTKKSICHSV